MTHMPKQKSLGKTKTLEILRGIVAGAAMMGITASLNMPPWAFVDDDHFPEIPTVQKTFYRKGLAAPGFDPMNCLPTLVTHAGDYFKQHAADAKTGKPFFLYLALTSPHTPIARTP